MVWKNINQYTFADELFIEHEAIKELDGLNALVDWHSVERFLVDLHSYKAGNKSWPPLMMFKCLLLQVWYNLSDPAIENSIS
jgi:IS5 family transposase